jgi:hypothetical protein
MAINSSIDLARGKINEGVSKLEKIQKDADLTTPKLEETAKELSESLNSALGAVDEILNDQRWWPTTRRFIRRLLSRESIIAVVAIIAIWAGGLDAEQAIGVAVAGAGLILGRSAVKLRSRNVET